MKICIVCPRLCHGGAERVAVTLANGFIHRGHQVVFLTDLYEEQTYQLDEAVLVKNLVAVSNPKYKKWLSAIRIVRSVIKKERPDVMIGIMSLCSIVAKLAAMGTDVPVIATEHGSYERPDSAPLTKWEKFYKFYIGKIFNCVTVLTDADRIKIGKQLKNVVVMPNPLAIEPIKMSRQRENTLLAAGRVDDWHYKGLDILIKAFSKLVQGYDHSGHDFCHDSSKQASLMAFAASKIQSEGWKLQIAGVWRNPETRVYLDGIAEECGVLDKIEYLGFVDDMKTLYQESSIFVLSSRYEGFGLVLIEAMSQGCACIACDYKGRQKEILCPNGQVSGSKFQVQSLNNGVEVCENGILCEPDNVDALAEAMKTMIMEDEYRESVRQNAVERSKYYSIENTIERWEKLLFIRLNVKH